MTGPRLDEPHRKLIDEYIGQRRAKADAHLVGTFGMAVGRAQGSWVYDVADRPFLDFGPGGAVNLLGHRNDTIGYLIQEHTYHYLYPGEGFLQRFPAEYAEALARHLPEGFKVLVLTSLAEARAVAAGLGGPIVDETATGFGRTGRMWGNEHGPGDVVLLGPSGGGGLPFAAVAAHSDRWHTVAVPPMANHPLVCGAALAVLRGITDELLEQVRTTAAALTKGLNELAAQFSFLGPPRGIGLLQFLQLKDKERAQAFRDSCRDSGLLIHPDLALTPPLTVTEREVNHAVDILADVCLDWG